MSFQVLFDGGPIPSNPKEIVLRYQTPISAVRIDFRSKVTDTGQLLFWIYGTSSLDATVNGMDRPIVGTSTQVTDAFTLGVSKILTYNFQTPVTRCILHAEAPVGLPDLYVALLDEYKA